MSNFQKWQAEKDFEEEHFNPSYVAWGVFGIFAAVIFMLLLLLFGPESEQDACEELGGTFTLVGEEFSPALKQTIDIYGCVK